MKDDALRNSVYKITQCDKKILDLIYGEQKLTWQTVNATDCMEPR